MKEGPDADTPFKDDFKKLPKEEQENACSAHCADANMPPK